MGTSLDGPNATPSLGQRRQAASNLPTFELPPPSHFQLAAQQPSHKIPPLMIGQQHQNVPAVSVGNLLTPPSNSASESGANSHNMQSGTTPNGHHIPILPYTSGFWGTGTTPNSFGTGLTPQPWGQHNPLYANRSMFSPGLRNSTNSPSTGEHTSLPPPPYELSHAQSYPATIGIASPPVSSTPSAHSHMVPNMMSAMPRSQSQASPISPADGLHKPSPMPGTYAPMSASNTPQSLQYGFQNHTPMSQSPHPSHLNVTKVSPPLTQGPMLQRQHPQDFIKPPYPGFTLPAMPGPIHTNFPMPPGSQLSGLPTLPTSGYLANGTPMFAPPRTNSPQQPVNERPFKCDQCPQSFNRNHDLKRHKRIHLAVKPFPCKHCDKSFSRKDALKRHILVKGCGNATANDAADGTKSEASSDNVGEGIPPISAVA